jgi:hypothetical protein
MFKKVWSHGLVSTRVQVFAKLANQIAMSVFKNFLSDLIAESLLTADWLKRQMAIESLTFVVQSRSRHTYCIVA